MQASPASSQETARNNIIREIVETERKYVQDLEHMQVSRCHFALNRPRPAGGLTLPSLRRNTRPRSNRAVL